MYDIGIVLPMAFPECFTSEEKILENLKKIAIDGYFNVVEFGQIKNLEIRHKVTELLKSSKLKFSYSGHSILLSQNLNINSVNETERKKAVSMIKSSISEAVQMGAISYSLLSNSFSSPIIDNHINALACSLKEICEYSKSLGEMPILLEVFDSEVDKCSLIGPNDRVKKLVDKMSSVDNFGLMLDLSHFPLLNESVDESFNDIADYVKHIHIGNAVVKPGYKGYGDQHPRFGYPNSENDVDEVYELLKKLEEINYTQNNNIITFEVRPQENESSDLVIANAKRTLNKAFSKLN